MVIPVKFTFYLCIQMTDIVGQALHDYYFEQTKSKLWINNRYGPREQMPLATYFRSEEDMPDLEWLAIEQCRGSVLDIGAGAGSHALLLQENKIEVTALEISPLAVAVMNARGVNNAVTKDIFTYNKSKYDTLLLLMNGIGLAGSIQDLKILLRHLKTLLKQHGQILFDSSDINYLYEGAEVPNDRYYGEIWYQYEYKRKKSDWFSWLYVDETTMTEIATAEGFKMEVLMDDESGQYIARLTI